LIIGGGPTGLFAAFYAGLRGMSVKLIDSLEVLGGQLTTLYPEKYIYDVAGFPQILAKDLAANLIEQAMQYRPQTALGEQVRELRFDPATRVYTVRTDKQAHPARAVLIAAGVGSFQPKTLPLANAALYEGCGLHYFVKDIGALAGQRVLIVGGGDSAVDWANTLAPIAADVTLIHRRDQFRAHEDSVAKMRSGSTVIKVNHELKAIDGDGRIESALIYDNRSKHEEMLSVDAVLVNIGFNSSLGPINNWGLEIEGGSIKVDAMMQTNRPGVFAAGDIAAFAGKLKLIATGFGEACVAVNYAKHYLDPASNIFPGHSSNLKR
jgi:thioredoxin reductase